MKNLKLSSKTKLNDSFYFDESFIIKKLLPNIEHRTSNIFLCLFLFLVTLTSQAQDSYTLKEAVNYALKNSGSVKNAEVDAQIAQLRVKEITAAGLPQIAGQFAYTSNILIPTQLIEAKNFNPQAKDGEVMKLRFGVPWGGQAGIGLNQLVFDASWLVGLRAADTYRQLANHGITQSKLLVVENVTKAYYSVLVSEERAKILDLNVGRLDSLIRDTKAMYQQGFVEKIDIDRLQVQRNNLVTERQKIQNLIQLTYQLLKFQMTYPLKTPIMLKDKLSDSQVEKLAFVSPEDLNYEGRIEYQTLQTQRKLTELDIESKQKSYYPSVFFSGSLGAGHSNIRFNPFERWFGASAVTLGVRIPIYDSNLKKIQIEQARLNLVKIDQGANMMRQGFDLQADQALANLRNGLQTLDVQKRNLDLAQEILRVTKIKYTQGIGSNIEVLNAETSVREAQTNYFASLYDLLVAKVDLDKARGQLTISNEQ